MRRRRFEQALVNDATSGDLLEVVGGDNVLASAGTRYPKISLEEVLRSRPDVILDLAFAGKDCLPNCVSAHDVFGM